MNAALALHTVARRYCLEQHKFWCERYSEIVRNEGTRHPDGNHYTAKALATFPRYNVLDAIRVEIERLDPVKLGELETARTLLILAGEAAENVFTGPPIGEIEKKVITEEREAFCGYIRGLSLPDLNAVELLPYRRVLTVEESRAIWSRVRERWQIPEGHWYPLADCEISDVVAFKTEAFEEAVPHERLQGILAVRGIRRLWELKEYGPEYEQDIRLFEAHYDGAEGYWSSEDFDWIIYASHESSVTVAGWLLQDLKAIWPTWKEQVWTGFD